MTWSAPHAFTANEQVSAATLNTYVSDDLQYLYDNRFDATNYGVAPLLDESTGSALSLTTNWQDVPNLSITLGGAGTYVLMATLFFHIAGTPALYRYVYGQLLANNVAQSGQIVLYAPQGQDVTQNNIWTYTAASAGLVAKMQAKQSADTNTCDVANSRMMAWEVSAP